MVHVDGEVDPLRDIDTIDTELILADLEAIAKRIDRFRKMGKSGDKEALFHLGVAEKVEKLLGSGQPARAGEWSEDEAKSV